MIIDKIQKRAKIRVLRPDTEARLGTVRRDAQSNVALVAYQAIQDTELNPDDVIMVDVRILIERANT